MQPCLKCLQMFSETNFRVLQDCEHIFCCKCLVDYINLASISLKKCLNIECTANIPDSIIKEYLSKEENVSNNQIISLQDSVETELFNSEDSSSFKQDENFDDNENSTEALLEIDQDSIKQNHRLAIEQLYKDNLLLPNPNDFVCSICEEFILSGMGVILRNCLHTFCMTCFKETIKSMQFINRMTCLDPKCKKPLESCEILGIINEERLIEMIIHEAAPRFFQCKNESCPGMWEVSFLSGSYICPECNETNCLDCQDVHANSSCEEFRETKRYINAQSSSEILDTNRHIKCFLCNNKLIQDGGCGSLYCDNCGSNTCVFTGKICGQHNPEICYCRGQLDCVNMHNYCECTARIPCDVNCIYGCHPEDKL